MAIGGNGQQVGLASGGGTTGRLITLRPGATAHVILNVLAPNCEHPVKATLYAYPPGQAQRQSTGITQGFCRTWHRHLPTRCTPWPGCPSTRTTDQGKAWA